MKRHLFSNKELSVLPIGFQHLISEGIGKNQQTAPTPDRPKTLTVVAYQTDSYRASNFYKPISMII